MLCSATFNYIAKAQSKSIYIVTAQLFHMNEIMVAMNLTLKCMQDELVSLILNKGQTAH